MINAEQLINNLEETFTRIQHNQMKGIPILNPVLKVEAVGFQEWDDLIVGVLITPWFMNLMIFPREKDAWDKLSVGTKQTHLFPSGTYECMVNEFDGVGRCQTFPIHSPMNEFDSQEMAVFVARMFIEKLMTESENEDVALDEQRLGKFLQGQDMEQIHQQELEEKVDASQCQSLKKKTEQPLTRRELLRAAFSGDSE